MSYGALPSTHLVAEGRFEEAVAQAARDIASIPGEPEAYFNRGQALAGLGRYEDAIADYQRALEMDASASALEAETVDDELFFALRCLADSQRADPARATATLERYRQLRPAGRHLADVRTWVDHLQGVEEVWFRDRV